MTEPPPPATGEDSNLGRRVVVGAGWMVAMRWIDRAIGLVSIAILARLLVPEDFGIVGYAMLVIALLELMSGMSIDDALIREREGDRDYYSAAWTMNVLRGIGLEPTRFVAAAWRPVVASLAMCAAVWLAQSGFPPAADFGGHAWSLARSVAVGALTYAGCALALWVACGRPDGAERRLLSALARYGFPLRRT